MNQEVENLEEKVHWLEEEIVRLKEENAKLKQQQNRGAEKERKSPTKESTSLPTSTDTNVATPSYIGTLTPPQIERYSRQLLLQNGFGVAGQQKLLQSKVLVVGAGGIGSTLILYLAACGVGNITVVDFDTVELSNLHRQVIHTTAREGVNKAESARQAALALNPTIKIDVVKEPLSAHNALAIIAGHDVVVDATDNPQTRYLINDACVLADKPLVSGSAMGTEGQLTVYHYNDSCPCYRCLYPTPNATEGSKSCADNGVLGPVPGLIGILQAVEVMKIITKTGNVLSDKLLIYDALQCTFLRIKKPPKQNNCPACGKNPTITDMEQSAKACQSARGPSCGVATRNATKLPDKCSISATDYDRVRQSEDHILLDVRVKEQFDLCSLPGSINLPLAEIAESMDKIAALSNGNKPIYCLCRRGIASAEATRIIVEAIESKADTSTIHSVKNIAGGLNAWRAKVDPSFPKY